MTIQDYTGLYRMIQDYTGLYMTIQGYIGLYRTIQDFTVLYRTIQDYIKEYRGLNSLLDRLIKTGDRHTDRHTQHTHTHTQNLWNLEVLTHLKTRTLLYLKCLSLSPHRNVISLLLLT